MMSQNLTLQPGQASKAHVESLKETGLSERAILDAVLVISYFNFVNRMVLALGVEAIDHDISGYKY